MKTNIKLTPAFLKNLAADVYLDLSDEEILEIIATEKEILHRFEKVLAIDTQGVKPLIYPIEAARKYLRDDDSAPVTVDQTAVLANAATTSGPYVTIMKVIK